jgi:hypothetical protein
MRCRRVVCLIVLSVGVAVGCSTSMKLADAPAAAPAAGVVGNRPPSVKIEGAPATTREVPAGSRLSLRANVYDPDGDAVTLQWTATAGALGSVSTPRTNWTAPTTATPVTIALRATDSSGASASDTLVLHVLTKR